jgi:ribonuclease P protein component
MVFGCAWQLEAEEMSSKHVVPKVEFDSVLDGLVKPSYRFQPQQRLLKPAEYQFVFEKAYKSSDKYFILLVRPTELAWARLGLVIAKKRVKQAVERNRIKRLVRESFRHHQHQLAGLDCIVMVKNDIAQADNQALRTALIQHWQFVTRRCKKS